MVFGAGDEFLKTLAKESAALRDFDAVVAEDGLARLGQEEGEGVRRVGEVVQEDAVQGVEELHVKIVNPELVEVAEDDVARAVRDDELPIFEGLA